MPPHFQLVFLLTSFALATVLIHPLDILTSIFKKTKKLVENFCKWDFLKKIQPNNHKKIATKHF